MKLNDKYHDYIVRKAEYETTSRLKPFANKIYRDLKEQDSLSASSIKRIVDKQSLNYSDYTKSLDAMLLLTPVVNYVSQDKRVRRSNLTKGIRNQIKALYEGYDLNDYRKVVDRAFSIVYSEDDSIFRSTQEKNNFVGYLNQLEPQRKTVLNDVFDKLKSQDKLFKSGISNKVFREYTNLIDSGLSVKEAAEGVSNMIEINHRDYVRTYFEMEAHEDFERIKIETAAANGFKHKYWRTQRDRRVRTSHAILDGEIVEYDEPFKMGSERPMYPGDSSLPIGERINCRCFTEFTFVKRGTRQGADLKSMDPGPEIKPVIKPTPVITPPKTLESFKDLEEQYLTRNQSKYERNFTPEEHKRNRNMVQNLVNKNSFGMNVGRSDLKFIFEDNKFKNQFETNQSRGFLNKETRKSLSKQLFNTNVEEVLDSDYEKYGYLMEEDIYQAAKSRIFNRTSQYGDIQVRFKKENVFNRTTMTIGDSLGEYYVMFGGEPEDLPIKVDDIRETPFIDDLSWRRNQEIYESFEKGNLDKFSELAGTYVELQYHDELKVDDIDSMTFNFESFKDYVERGEEQTIKTILDKNIKVYMLNDERLQKNRKGNIFDEVFINEKGNIDFREIENKMQLDVIESHVKRTRRSR